MNCAKCGRSILGKSYGTPLGERVCGTCNDKVNGFIIGAATGGAGGAATGPGLMKWVRQSVDDGRKGSQ